MVVINLKCPSCGAELQLNADREVMYCSYCGSKILLKQDSVEHIYRTVDEVALKEIELQKYIIEGKKKAKEVRKKNLKKITKILILTLVLSIILSMVFEQIFKDEVAIVILLRFCGLFAFLGLLFVLILCLIEAFR